MQISDNVTDDFSACCNRRDDMDLVLIKAYILYGRLLGLQSAQTDDQRAIDHTLRYYIEMITSLNN